MEINQKTVVSQQRPGGEPVFSLKKDGVRLLVITLAAVIMAANINSFVHEGGLYPGGATGLTLLIQHAAEQYAGVALPYTLINLILNTIPVYIGFRFIGKKLTIYSLYMIVLTSVLTDLLPAYPITYDILLISLFGGMINGFVISLCLIMNANTGGTDFIGIFLSEKKNVDAWDVTLVINACILLAAGLMFGWDKAMYSIIFQFVSTQVVHAMYRRYQRTTMLIVTDQPEDVCTVITEISNHGATVLQGEGAYEGEKRYLVYSVVSRGEYKAITKAIRKTDAKAFINSIRTEQLSGRFYRRPME